MKFIHRTVERFRANPGSIRNATVTIISLTAFVVTVGAVIVRVFDREEYPTFGKALWFTLQTVTTVGYGDVTPEKPIGRVVASIVMITAIGLLTVVTAAITSVFIEAARARIERSHRSRDADTMERLEASLTSIADRLDRLESTLSANTATTEQSAQDDGG